MKYGDIESLVSMDRLRICHRINKTRKYHYAYAVTLKGAAAIFGTSNGNKRLYFENMRRLSP